MVTARYRWRQFDRHGYWKDTREEAIDAAVKAGIASRDAEVAPNEVRVTYYDVGVSIEERA